MILVDYRTGSVEFAPLLSSHQSVCKLEFGDFAWSGHGPEGQASIGVELKRLPDFLKSMTSGRLSGHQLIGMLEQYDFVYILIEGSWRPNSNTGLLEVPKGKTWVPASQGSHRFMARDFYNYINTLQVICGVIVVTTYNKQETAKWLDSCYRWWNKKWEAHKSHLQFHAPVNPSKRPRYVRLTRPNLTTLIANQIPGIGVDRAKKLGKVFATPRGLFEASEEELEWIDGIGSVSAKKIMEALS